MRRQVRLWISGQPHQVHAVLVQADTVYAVNFIQSPRCDSCVVRFALSSIDSVQVRAPDGNKTIAVVIFSLPIVYLVVRITQIPRT